MATSTFNDYMETVHPGDLVEVTIRGKVKEDVVGRYMITGFPGRRFVVTRFDSLKVIRKANSAEDDPLGTVREILYQNTLHVVYRSNYSDYPWVGLGKMSGFTHEVANKGKVIGHIPLSPADPSYNGDDEKC